MIDEGARSHRLARKKETAFTILKSLLNNEPTLLNLQHELVDQGIDLNKTEAVKEVDAGISEKRGLLEREIENTKDEMEKALAAKDQKWIEDVATEQVKFEQQVRDTKSAQEEIKLSMEKLFAEKEEQYRKAIRDMDDEVKKLKDQ